MTNKAKEAFERLMAIPPTMLVSGAAIRQDLLDIKKEIEISDEITLAAMTHAKKYAVMEAMNEALQEANKQLAGEANMANGKMLAIIGVLGEKTVAELLTVKTFENAAKGAQDAADELRKKIEVKKGV
jgi:hypothetical protein